MNETLFDFADFPETAPRVFPPEMWPCGIHRKHFSADIPEHIDKCWHGACPSCGDPVSGDFDVHSNHYGAERGVCVSLQLRLNHLTYDICNRRLPAERDLTVLDLGWRIGPDGSQIPPIKEAA